MKCICHLTPLLPWNKRKKCSTCQWTFQMVSQIDTLVDSGVYVSAIPEDELERIKTYSRGNILKMGDPPAFQIQVANGQLEKPTAIATMWFEIRWFRICRAFRGNEKSYRTDHRICNYAVQQCNSGYNYTLYYIFPTLSMQPKQQMKGKQQNHKQWWFQKTLQYNRWQQNHQCVCKSLIPS